MNTTIRVGIGTTAFAGFLGSIPLANWMIHNVGAVCIPHGPCLLPVAPGFMAPSGVIVVGIALVARDVVQRCLGLHMGLLAIVIGSALSIAIAPPALVIASGAAFLLSELADCAIYTPLQRRRLMLAVLASSAVGLIVDSIVFLWLAFNSLAYLPGQVIGKAWGVALAIPAIRWIRRMVP
jgi:uncharacterized PurR-regulated membrane protein YhhQ (DUF165 family)